MRHILVAVLFATAGFASASDVLIPDVELSIGGIAIGDTEQHVLSVLGTPQQRIETGESTSFQYPGLTVSIGWLEQQAPDKARRVVQLSGTGAKACTPSGICPGMPFEQAVSQYGQPVVAHRETGTFMEFYSHHCWLQLGSSDGLIRSISAVCQP